MIVTLEARRALRRLGGIAWLPFLTAACHAPAPVPGSAKPTPGARPLAPKPKAGLEVPALHATELGRVQSATFGPYLGMRADGALVVWAAIEGGERHFSAAALSPQGRPLARASVLGNAPEELGVVAVRGLRDGYAVLFTRPGGKSEAVEALCVSSNGEAHGGSNRLAELSGRALWVELVPVEQGALAFYAVRGAEKQKAELWAVAIDSQCRAVERNLVFKNALAWQAAPAPKGAFLSVVQPGDATGGVVSVATMDATSKLKSTTRVTAEAGADLDLDAVSLGDRLVLAWTDQRRLDSTVVSAVIDAAGKMVAPPERLTPPEGDQALLRLVPPSSAGKRAFVALERLEARPASGRFFSLSALNELGRMTGSRVELGYANDDGGMPELAAVGDSLAALTLAPLCRRGLDCDASDVAPTYVRFDEALSVVATEPLRLEPLAGRHAELDFGLGCSRANCLAISALSRVPAQIFATELELRSHVWAAPVRDITKPAPPRVKEFESVAEADSVATLSVASAGGQDWLGYITDFDDTAPWKLLDKPAADGRREPLRAQIGLTRIAANVRAGAPAAPIAVSVRAHSVGGVAIAPGDGARGDIAVAWAGLDGGVPQLFITQFDKAGTKVAQRMLTHKKGELSDIALSWVGDGWVVAWVDERTGDPEVYATKVDAKLNRTGPEQRITSAEGAASDLCFAFDGKALRLAWSDARGADASENADIYTVLLRPRDAAREGNELRVTPTRAHSFAPALYPRASGFALAWIERGDDSSGGRLAFADISADGAAGALATVVLPEAAEPRALALDCPDKACRFLATSESNGRSELLGGVWDGAKVERLSAVLTLSSGGVAGGVAPSLRGNVALVADRAPEGTRIRRLVLQW